MTSTLRLPAPVILATTLAMSQGARNCPFLTLTTLPVAAAASSRSVCRHRKAGICRTSTACATSAHCAASCTSVSTGKPSEDADLGEDRQRLFQAEAARRRGAGAVGLVERGLVDEADLQPRGDLLQRGGHFERMRAAFELAGPGDDRDRQIIAEFDRANGDDRCSGIQELQGHFPRFAATIGP